MSKLEFPHHKSKLFEISIRAEKFFQQQQPRDQQHLARCIIVYVHVAAVSIMITISISLRSRLCS